MFAKRTKNYELAMQGPLFDPVVFRRRQRKTAAFEQRTPRYNCDTSNFDGTL